jgi:putative membrane protein
MLAHPLYGADAKPLVARAVADAEAQTCAEIVVSVRRTSGSYRDVDVIAGAAAGFAALLLMIFHPKPVRDAAIPLGVVIVFFATVVVFRSADSLRRLLLGRRRLDELVRTAARGAFFELGVGRTRGRTGVLVYVSTFERRVAIVADTGVAEADLAAVRRRLEVAVRARDLAAFADGVRALGPVLAEKLPCAADDMNELPDGMVTS